MTVSDTPTRRTSGRTVVPPADRFRPKVDTSGGPDACWPWTGATTGPYGSFKVDGKATTAHSFAKFLATGEHCPPGKAAQHTCRTPLTPLCCNPAHVVYDTRGAGGTRHLRGAAHPSSKLTDQQVRDLRARVADGEDRTSLAAEYRVSYSSVINITTGRRRVDAGLPEGHTP